MRLKENLELLIQAPRPQVWAAFADFASWPRWSSFVKEVRREGSGWRFRVRTQTVVELVLVLEAVRRQGPEYLEFATLPGAPRNVDLHGLLRLDEAPGGATRLHLTAEFGPHYDSALMSRVADWWVTTFDEPSKIVKTVFEEFKRHLETPVVSR